MNVLGSIEHSHKYSYLGIFYFKLVEIYRYLYNIFCNLIEGVLKMSSEITDAGTTHHMYCVKCRTMVMVSAPKKIVMKSSRHALQGKCPHCSTSTFKITKAE